MRLHQGPPRPAAVADWKRYAACHLCSALAGRPCTNMNLGYLGDVLDRPHSERLLAVDRTPEGLMLLGRRDHSATSQSRPGTTHGAHAHHVAIDGVSVCGGALLADDTHRPLPRLSRRELCQRFACKRLWREEYP